MHFLKRLFKSLARRWEKIQRTLSARSSTSPTPLLSAVLLYLLHVRLHLEDCSTPEREKKTLTFER
jgi:hypothetical protein